MIKTDATEDVPRALTERGRRRCQKLIEAATSCFLKNGYEATSLNEIVHDAGGSLTTVYQYFQNKEGLFWAVLETFVSKVKERYVTFQFVDDDGHETLKKFVTHIYENMCDPQISRFMLLAMQIESLREKAVDIMYRELLGPLQNILMEIGKRYQIRFVFGVEETLLCVLRHIRGSVLEFMFQPGKMDENKRRGIEQSKAVFWRLVDTSEMENV